MKNQTKLLAGLAITFALAYQLLALLAVVLRPDLGVYWHTISEWAIGKYGWVMRAAFVSSGTGYLFLFAAVRSQVSGGWGRTGLVFLFLCFLGTVTVGLFVTDPYPPDFTLTTTLIHTLGGSLGMLLLPLSAILINRNLAKQNAFASSKNILRWTAFLPLAAFVGFMIHLNLYVIPLGENAVGENVPIGYPPRFMFLVYHIWLFITAYVLVRTKGQHIR